ncbi:RNase H [Fulvimarina manganoxydans]|uniref:RNase H n=1 Tax=Fulvimarina manganoxydans TaxID=937218 RepID=A0A1W2EAP1_9HYPH|nr:RNase H [Fulvimarina manganoxydans]
MNTEDTIAGIRAGRHYLIHTDGACSGNPGPGGCAALLQLFDGLTMLKEREIKRAELKTTNNRMQLRAALVGLRALEVNDTPAIIVSDSAYLVDGMN